VYSIAKVTDALLRNPATLAAHLEPLQLNPKWTTSKREQMGSSMTDTAVA
jgi:hypothetical protein